MDSRLSLSVDKEMVYDPISLSIFDTPVLGSDKHYYELYEVYGLCQRLKPGEKLISPMTREPMTSIIFDFRLKTALDEAYHDHPDRYDASIYATTSREACLQCITKQINASLEKKTRPIIHHHYAHNTQQDWQQNITLSFIHGLLGGACYYLYHYAITLLTESNEEVDHVLAAMILAGTGASDLLVRYLSKDNDGSVAFMYEKAPKAIQYASQAGFDGLSFFARKLSPYLSTNVMQDGDALRHRPREDYLPTP